MYVVKEEGKYKLLDSSENPDSAGVEVLERIEAGNLKGARILLDWLREEQHLGGGDDPLSGPVFPRFWLQGKPAEAAPMKLAGAALLVNNKATADLAVPIFEEALPSVTDPALKTNVQLALAVAYGMLYQPENEAREVLIQAMDLENLDEPTPPYWYAFGRIAEQYGLRETAPADYARVPKPKRASELAGSSYRLAFIRLQTMNSNAKSATKIGGINKSSLVSSLSSPKGNAQTQNVSIDEAAGQGYLISKVEPLCPPLAK